MSNIGRIDINENINRNGFDLADGNSISLLNNKINDVDVKVDELSQELTQVQESIPVIIPNQEEPTETLESLSIDGVNYEVGGSEKIIATTFNSGTSIYDLEEFSRTNLGKIQYVDLIVSEGYSFATYNYAVFRNSGNSYNSSSVFMNTGTHRFFKTSEVDIEVSGLGEQKYTILVHKVGDNMTWDLKLGNQTSNYADFSNIIKLESYIETVGSNFVTFRGEAKPTSSTTIPDKITIIVYTKE